ncbi:DUF952 domain-containing protein [Vagococcus sp. JNUCC 83]
MIEVANAIYKEFDELIVLEVDVDKLTYPNKLKIEDLYDYKVDYPHLYSILNMSAVISDFLLVTIDKEFQFGSCIRKK